MLAAQMAVIHTAAMRFGRNLVCAETLEQRDSCERTLNKLTRTFAIQMEALKRYLTGVDQKFTVQHVTVNDGGQAMVGTVNTGGRKKEAMSENRVGHAAISRSHASSTRSGSVRTERAMNHEA